MQTYTILYRFKGCNEHINKGLSGKEVRNILDHIKIMLGKDNVLAHFSIVPS